MTDAEVLAVIRERVKKWRTTEHARATYLSVGPEILDDLDPDRIDGQAKMRQALIEDLCALTPAKAYWPEARDMANALLAKGWKK